MNYEQDKYVDPNALDVEWLRQPQLVAQYNEAAVRAKDERDRLKERLGVIMAEVADDVRKSPGTYGLEKPTKDAVDAAVLQSRKYRTANDQYLQARLDADLCQVAANAIEARKSTLEGLVKLMAMNYFATPTEPRDLSAEYQRFKERVVAIAATPEGVRGRLNAEKPEPEIEEKVVEETGSRRNRG